MHRVMRAVIQHDESDVIKQQEAEIAKLRAELKKAEIVKERKAALAQFMACKIILADLGATAVHEVPLNDMLPYLRRDFEFRGDFRSVVRDATADYDVYLAMAADTFQAVDESEEEGDES